MEIITINKQKLLKRPDVDRFALQQVLQGFSPGREYNINGTWTSEKPSAKPDGARVVFNSRKEFCEARDAYFALEGIAKIKQFNPEYPEEIAKRLINARRTGEPTTLFVPWGVRPEGELGASELAVMEKLRSFQRDLEEKQIPTEILLMPADLYATKVNRQVNTTQVKNYFEQVTATAQEKGFTVKPWSQIRAENLDTYAKRSAELTEDQIRAMLTGHKVKEAIAAAGRRSGYEAENDIKDAAFRYLRERIVEAEIIETVYNGIKVSVVPKNKDNEVDRELPRFYMIPSDLQLPWLK